MAESAAELAQALRGKLSGQLSISLVLECQRDLALLLYLLTPKHGWEPEASPSRGNPICAMPGCKQSWRSAGGLINYAQPENDPVWYCQEHGMAAELHGNQPPGTLPDSAVALALAKDMAGKWNAYLARLERAGQ